MHGVRVLIADQNEAFRENLAELLRSRYTVETTGNGKDALSMLDTFAPDILVTDLILPNIDGFYLLEQASKRPAPPEILVITRHLSGYVLDKVLSFGIHSMLRKPCDLMAAESNVRAIAQRLPVVVRQKEAAAVSELLLRLGIQSHRAGYAQLLLAIPMFARDAKQPVNKVIYTDIARQLGFSDSRSVEHSIRDVLKDYWMCGDSALWHYLFPPETLKKRKIPSNKQFIARLVEYLYLEQAIK